MGFEPTTSALGRLHSTTELRPQPQTTGRDNSRPLDCRPETLSRRPRRGQVPTLGMERQVVQSGDFTEAMSLGVSAVTDPKRIGNAWF
jgi:hypothetical protein